MAIEYKLTSLFDNNHEISLQFFESVNFTMVRVIDRDTQQHAHINLTKKELSEVITTLSCLLEKMDDKDSHMLDTPSMEVDF